MKKFITLLIIVTMLFGCSSGNTTSDTPTDSTVDNTTQNDVVIDVQDPVITQEEILVALAEAATERFYFDNEYRNVDITVENLNNALIELSSLQLNLMSEYQNIDFEDDEFEMYVDMFLDSALMYERVPSYVTDGYYIGYIYGALLNQNIAIEMLYKKYNLPITEKVYSHIMDDMQIWISNGWFEEPENITLELSHEFEFDNSEVTNSKTQVLNDIKKSIEQRWNLANTPDDGSVKGDLEDRYICVMSELSILGKYSDTEFGGDKFNTLVHMYIDGCEMQERSLHLYKDGYYDALWSYGSGLRYGSVALLYEKYGLEIDKDLYGTFKQSALELDRGEFQLSNVVYIE